MKKILSLLNQYLVAREQESQAKKDKETLRDQILKLLPPSRTAEWVLAGWGKVTYKQPKASLTVDLDKLALEFPKAYKACVSEEPNSPRFCVYPEQRAIVAAFSHKEVIDGRVQSAVQPDA